MGHIVTAVTAAPAVVSTLSPHKSSFTHSQYNNSHLNYSQYNLIDLHDPRYHLIDFLPP